MQWQDQVDNQICSLTDTWHNWFMQWQDQVDNQICSLSKGERLRANERQHYSLHKMWVHKLPLSHTHTHTSNET